MNPSPPSHDSPGRAVHEPGARSLDNSPGPAQPGRSLTFTRRTGRDLGLPLLLLLLLAAVRLCPGQGSEVVVVYNRAAPESQGVAEYYAKQRSVPSNQVLGLTLPTTESISRSDYLTRLEQPLLKWLEEQRLVTYGPATNRAPSGRAYRQLFGGRIRYIVLCYGVPVRILRDSTLVETPAPPRPELAGRNEAAVDTQLAIAPLADHGYPWSGPIPSPFLATTNRALMNPANSLFMVTRLDGPSAAIARGLVDQARDAETNGLWGRAYFDARGLATNSPYHDGDVMMRNAAEVARQIGFETTLDQAGATFSAGFPMSQIALYAGWYDQVVSGPFTQPTVEFMPGAFAYHLYSFSASTIRSSNSWVGTLLQKGATCTMGCVDEPYLAGTPDIGLFTARFVALGFTFGEAAYASIPALSWQVTVIGDPLYRPFSRPPPELLESLQRRNSDRLAWYYLLAVNQRLAAGARPAEAIEVLESLPLARTSAILTEKLADLYWSRGSMSDAIDLYEVALRRNPSPVQRQRLLLTAAEKRAVAGPDETALEHYRTFLKEHPSYPERLKVYQAMLPLARRRQLTNETARLESEIQKLIVPPATPKN